MQVFGHSQGTSSFLVLASEKPEYNAKLKMIHALGPAIFLSHMKSPFLRMAAPFVNSLHVILFFEKSDNIFGKKSIFLNSF